MPMYDFKCDICRDVVEKITPSTVDVIECEKCEAKGCPGLMWRQLSVPAAFRFPDMATLNRKRQRIKEPIWRDKVTGKAESVF